MAVHVTKLPLPSVPCFCTILLLICSLLSSSHARCKCSGSDQDLREIRNTSSTFKQMDGYLFTSPRNISYASVGNFTFLPGGLSSNYTKNSSVFDMSHNGWYIVAEKIDLWETSDNGTLIDMSFNVSFTMSVYPVVPEFLVFSILPIPMVFQEVLTPRPTQRNGIVDGCDFFVQIGKKIIDARAVNHTLTALWVKVTIDVPEQNTTDASYSVWIDYERSGHHLRVYVDKYNNTGQSKPDSPIVEESFNFSNAMFPGGGYFGLSSSIGQLLQLQTWSMTAEELPVTKSLGKPPTMTILSLVLGSVGATAMTAVAVCYYFNSKYRRWTKEQDKLAKTMQSLPGVPTQVDFADIRKATKNFDEKMKLGKGGFGAVYGCTLPATASRTGRAIEVAVKKFMRAVEDRRYNDFLAEVSIINRLRHKNIVALVGWSYNKGEPLLVYEYMTNGSLDQHLFRRGGNGQQHQDAVIRHWDTRYGIARDIATGLHYVHHEHEPMVLHRDIKASNIMLDSTFRGRLGDFGIACTVPVDRSSVSGVVGTMGYIAPDYAISHKSTRQSDIYAFGVLILEIVTGKMNGDVPPDDDHITDWVWRLHWEEKLLEAVDAGVLAAGPPQLDVFADEAKRLLLLGLACTNPNPFNRPSMVEVVQVITKLVPPPDMPLERPTFVWPPKDWRSRNSVYSTAVSNWDGSSASTVELVQAVSQEKPQPAASGGNYSSVYCMASEEIQSKT